MNWTVDLGYPIANIGSDWYLDKEIEEAAGHERDSSGAGFGFRDMQFEFGPDEAKAEEVAEKIRAILRKHNVPIAEPNKALDGTEAYVGVYDMDECNGEQCDDCEYRDSCDTYKRYQEEKGVNG
jgi:hypothetical protein